MLIFKVHALKPEFNWKAVKIIDSGWLFKAQDHFSKLNYNLNCQLSTIIIYFWDEIIKLNNN